MYESTQENCIYLILIMGSVDHFYTCFSLNACMYMLTQLPKEL